MAVEFCPRCGTQRTGAFRYCRSCQFDFDAGPALGGPLPPPSPSVPPASAPSDPAPSLTITSTKADVASAMLDLERLRLVLIPFRLIGVALGGILWWITGGALYDIGGVVVVLIALVVLAFGGLYLGNLAGLAFARR